MECILLQLTHVKKLWITLDDKLGVTSGQITTYNIDFYFPKVSFNKYNETNQFDAITMVKITQYLTRLSHILHGINMKSEAALMIILLN